MQSSGAGSRANMYTGSTTVTVSGQKTYYNRLSSVTGVGAHTHSVTIPSLEVSSSYTNSNQQTVSTEDAYITVYMYKRTA